MSLCSNPDFVNRCLTPHDCELVQSRKGFSPSGDDSEASLAIHPCPTCGHQAESNGPVCCRCGAATLNGAGAIMGNAEKKPVVPPEVNGWVIEQVPPEMIEEAVRTFKEE